ncbi:hypothetical protein ACWDUL_33615 [Nocardia niigatensis]
MTAPLVICQENVLPGAAMMAVAPPPGGLEPTHACRNCDIPLWLMWSWDNYPFAACPLCGEEIEQLYCCRTCDHTNCHNTGH